MTISFQSGREGVFLTTLLIFVIMLYLILVEGEKRKKVFKIRRLPPIDAIEEAVGRAVETGRPVHYNPGSARLNTMAAPSTIASLAILGYVARIAARQGARIITTADIPEIYPLENEIVREAFLAEGSDQFEEDDVMYIPQLKAVAGLLLRERVAANFFIGWYAHAALVVIESAARAGAINVSGASELSQVPFLVGCSDYCLIGEEVFAAGAYITKDPVQTSTIAGQDYIKFIIIASMIIGTILTMAGYPQLLKFLG